MDPVASTGSHRCVMCGRVFTWIDYRSKEAWDSLQAHECEAAELVGRTW